MKKVYPNLYRAITEPTKYFLDIFLIGVNRQVKITIFVCMNVYNLGSIRA